MQRARTLLAVALMGVCATIALIYAADSRARGGSVIVAASPSGGVARSGSNNDSPKRQWRLTQRDQDIGLTGGQIKRLDAAYVEAEAIAQRTSVCVTGSLDVMVADVARIRDHEWEKAIASILTPAQQLKRSRVNRGAPVASHSQD